MSEIKIDKGIPTPEIRGDLRYPWAKLEVGESFFAEMRLTNQAAHAARAYGRKFACRTVIENGVKGTRVWRIK